MVEDVIVADIVVAVVRRGHQRGERTSELEKDGTESWMNKKLR